VVLLALATTDSRMVVDVGSFSRIPPRTERRDRTTAVAAATGAPNGTSGVSQLPGVRGQVRVAVRCARSGGLPIAGVDGRIALTSLPSLPGPSR